MDYERPPAVVHHPVPLPPQPAPLAPIPPATAPALSSVQLPDGRIVTGYTLTPHPHPAPLTAPVEPRPAISRTAVNVALGGIGFGAICGGLVLLTTFIAALAALIQQLIILAAVIFGGWIAAQVLRHRPARSGTTVNIRKAVIKRNHFHT
ncbi:hypothetical protein [Streptomyces buecherae]|uniref:hypothetical protein n=1 Tax=Streptomyces buecherae TaxID=2763006 RepID=UPI00369F3766